MDAYLVLSATVDGDHRTIIHGKENLENYLTELFEEAEECDRHVQLCTSLHDYDPDYVGDKKMSILIFKGDIVVPQPVTTVTKWKV